MTIVYDAGVLIGADRNDREIWADHRARLELGLMPITTAPVVAQVSRTSRQVPLRLFLRGCDIQSFSQDQAHPVGELLAKSGSSDVVDAHVALVASKHHAEILTSDPSDLKDLAALLRPRPQVRRI